MRRKHNLHKDVLEYIKSPRSIPAICNQFNIDEFSAMRIVADLERRGKAVLSGFDRIYREDGGAIYLALYEAKHGTD